MKKVKLNLSGLTCGGCVKSVEGALQKAGAEDVKVTMNNAQFSKGKMSPVFVGITLL